MKKTSYLVNAARGGLINEKDLYNALKRKLITGAAIDVFENEPLTNSSLHSLDNIILTPHLGASTQEAKEGVSIAICEQVCNYLINEKLSNAVNMLSLIHI